MELRLDRVLMLRKHIKAIRLLRSTDAHIVAQMQDLALCRGVSSMSKSFLRHLMTALPVAARVRLGISPGQKNVLLRIVLRALDRTLTSEACNLYRDAIYAQLHQGAVWHWAAKT